MFRFSKVEAAINSVVHKRFNKPLLLCLPGEKEQSEISLLKPGTSGVAGSRKVTPI